MCSPFRAATVSVQRECRSCEDRRVVLRIGTNGQPNYSMVKYSLYHPNILHVKLFEVVELFKVAVRPRALQARRFAALTVDSHTRSTGAHSADVEISTKHEIMLSVISLASKHTHSRMRSYTLMQDEMVGDRVRDSAKCLNVAHRSVVDHATTRCVCVCVGSHANYIFPVNVKGDALAAVRSSVAHERASTALKLNRLFRMFCRGNEKIFLLFAAMNVHQIADAVRCISKCTAALCGES